MAEHAAGLLTKNQCIHPLTEVINEDFLETPKHIRAEPEPKKRLVISLEKVTRCGNRNAELSDEKFQPKGWRYTKRLSANVEL